MRRLIFIGLFVCASQTLGHSQTNTTQLPNGVVVHQAQGVEGVQKPKVIEQTPVRTMQDWTLPECIDALTHLEMKLNEAAPSEKTYYLEEKVKLTQRINELKGSN